MYAALSFFPFILSSNFEKRQKYHFSVCFVPFKKLCVKQNNSKYINLKVKMWNGSSFLCRQSVS